MRCLFNAARSSRAKSQSVMVGGASGVTGGDANLFALVADRRRAGAGRHNEAVAAIR